MSRVRGQDNMLERKLRTALWRHGVRYRLASSLPGKPDLVFPVQRVALFVDGCFWHRCPLHATYPRTSANFWEAKLNGNVDRDRRVDNALGSEGWTVVRVWEHDIESDLPSVVSTLIRQLQQSAAVGKEGPTA
jgi:DNA mismatch endonuclease (patch repair protein)